MTIHSKQEQEFVSKLLFKTYNVIENVWIGLKNSNNQFKWTDSSEIGFTNWAKGNPRNITDHNCVQMISDSSPIGQWADEFCDKKHLIVCQKAPIFTNTFLQKKFLEITQKLSDTQQLLSDTRKELSHTRKQLNETRQQTNQTNYTLSKYLNNLLSNKWINFKLFTDTDGKQKAFFFHINKTDPYGYTSLDEANKTCANFNASLVEIQTLEKQFIFESFFGQFGFETTKLVGMCLNAYREPSGKWKWLKSGKQFTYTNWAANHPSTDNDYNYIYIGFNTKENFGKWATYKSSVSCQVVCEVEVNF